MKGLIYFLPLSDNYSARGRPGRNAERGILPDLLSAILLCQAYKRNFTTRVMEGLTLNRFLHLHCERGIHYIRLGCSAGKKRRQFVMISSGRSSLPPASLMPVLATRRSVMRTFRLDESVNLSSQSERISKSSMVPHIFSAFCSVGESMHLPDLATNFCAVKLIFQLEPARFAFPGCTRTHMPRLPRRAVRCL